MFEYRMLYISLRKSSLVPDFLFSLLQLFTRVTVHSAPYLLLLNTLLVSVCSKDLLICFADHWRGEWDGVQADMFMNFTTFFRLIINFFLSILFFLTLDILPTPTTHDPRHLVTLSLNRAFSHDVTVAILVFQNNKTAAMLVFLTNPVGVDLFSYVNAFFCVNKFAQMLVT